MRNIICRYDGEFEHYSVPILENNKSFYLKAKLPFSIRRFDKDDFVENAIMSILMNDGKFIVYDFVHNSKIRFFNDVTKEIKEVLYYLANKVCVM